MDFVLNFFLNIQANFNFVKKDYNNFLENDENYHFETCCNFYHLLTRTIPKIKNFYLSLKLNNFKLFKFYLKEILLELMATNSPNYQKAILLQLLIFDFLEENNHNLFKFLEKEFSSLIEENNEAQLSLLSNEDSLTLSNHDLIEEKFLLVPHYFKIQKYLAKSSTNESKIINKNEKIIKIYKKLLLNFENKKFQSLQMDKNWKVFKPNENYSYSQVKIDYQFDYTLIKEKVLKTYQSLFNLMKSKEDIFEEIGTSFQDSDQEE